MKKTLSIIILNFIFLALFSQKNIFKEDFKNNKNKWALNSNIKKDSASLEVKKGQLILDNKQKDAAVALIEIPNKKIDILKDEEVTINFTINHLSGNKLNSYGLLLGENLPDNKFNGYGFVMVDTGYFKIFFSFNGKQTVVKDYTANEAIKLNNGINKFTIIKKRNQFHVLINNQWVHYFTIYDLKVKHIGVVVNEKQKIAFTDFTVESFTKLTDKKEEDKIKDLSNIIEQSQNNFKNAFKVKNAESQIITWLPYINESSTSKTNLLDSYSGTKYIDNKSYEETEAKKRVKDYAKYIEKIFVKFEKVEKITVLGKNTYWLSKNEKFQNVHA